jgi:hypothetical protein
MLNNIGQNSKTTLFEQSKTLKQFTTEAQRAQSFILLKAPSALLTIKRFSLCPLCLCGENFMTLVFKLALMAGLRF